MRSSGSAPPEFRPRADDLWRAFGLLSRLPLPCPPREERPAAHAAWAYPLVGVAVALLMALAGWIALLIGLPDFAAAGLMLLTGVMTTGALHEDGLADCADGFWGGWTVERRLEIMKDSRIGTYGVTALVISLGLRWVALAGLLATSGWALGLIAAAAASRAGMVAVMYALPTARPSGLSHGTGRPPRLAVYIAAGIGGFLVLFAGDGGPAALIAAISATFIAGWIARRKIGGQTGDVLGASQQIVEITVLLALLA